MVMDGRVIDPKDFKPDPQRIAAIRSLVFDLNESPEGDAALTHCLNYIAWLEQWQREAVPVLKIAKMLSTQPEVPQYVDDMLTQLHP